MTTSQSEENKIIKPDTAAPNLRKLDDGKWAKVNTSNMTPEKTKVIEDYVNNALAKRQPTRKIQRDVFFKFKVKIDFQQKPSNPVGEGGQVIKL